MTYINIDSKNIQIISRQFLSCDLRIAVDSMTEEASFEMIKRYVAGKYGEEYDD